MEILSGHIKGLSSIRIRLEGIGGGGNTIADHYSSYQSGRQRLCVCIADSDLRAPNGAHKETAARLAEVDDPGQPLCEYVITQARELENNIPTRFFNEVHDGNPNRLATIEFLERLEGSQIKEVRKYLDLKSGTKLGELMSYNTGAPEQTYWTPKLPTLAVLAHSINSRCVQSRTCQSPTSCTCRIVVGLGPNILDDTLRYVGRLSVKKNIEGLCSETRAEWERLGGLVLAWCCGSETISAL